MILNKIKKLVLVLVVFLSAVFQGISQEYNLNSSLEEYWPMANLEKPNYLEDVIDPTFGTKITRITGDPGTAVENVTNESWKTVARHGYSVRQPWNADESVIYLGRHFNYGGSWGSSLFLDGETYEVIKKATMPSGNESRWHPTEPNIRLILTNNSVKKWNYETNASTTLIEFSGYSNTTLGNYTGNFSNDGNMVAVLATRNTDGKKVGFALDLENNIKYPDIDFSNINVDFITISSLGTYIVVNANFGTGSDRTKVYDLEGTQTGPFWSNYGQPSHFDVTVDLNGDEVAVGVDKSVNDGRVISRRLSDGVITVVSPAGYASHTSARSINRPGWVYTISSSSQSWGPFYNEIIAVKLDGSRVERICNARNVMNIYDNQAQPCPSPSGNRVLFASDWSSNEVPIQAYVVDFRAQEVVTQIVADISGDLEICQNTETELLASGGDSYLWSTGETGQSIFVSPESTTTYSVTAFDASGELFDTAEATVTVNELPVLNVGEDFSILEGESATLQVTGAQNYEWSTGEFAQEITVSPTQTTTYTVYGYQNNCESEKDITVTVVEEVEAYVEVEHSRLCLGESTVITASGGHEYLWSNGATTPSIVVYPQESREYSVVVSNELDYETASVYVGVTNCNSLGVADATENELEFLAYQDANTSMLHVTISGFQNRKLYDMTIYDMSGKLIFSENLKNEQSNIVTREINIEMLSSGIYIMKLNYDQTQLIKKIPVR